MISDDHMIDNKFRRNSKLFNDKMTKRKVVDDFGEKAISTVNLEDENLMNDLDVNERREKRNDVQYITCLKCYQTTEMSSNGIKDLVKDPLIEYCLYELKLYFHEKNVLYNDNVPVGKFLKKLIKSFPNPEQSNVDDFPKVFKFRNDNDWKLLEKNNVNIPNCASCDKNYLKEKNDEENQQLSIAYCEQCTHYLCEFCLQQHRSMIAFEKHSTYRLSDIWNRTNDGKLVNRINVVHACPLHEMRPFILYCMGCRVPVCEECSRSHRQFPCMTQPFDKAKSPERKTLKMLIGESKQALKRLGKQKEDVSNIDTLVKRQWKRARENLEECIKRYQEMIEKKENDLKLIELPKKKEELQAYEDFRIGHPQLLLEYCQLVQEQLKTYTEEATTTEFMEMMPYFQNAINNISEHYFFRDFTGKPKATGLEIKLKNNMNTFCQEVEKNFGCIRYQYPIIDRKSWYFQPLTNENYENFQEKLSSTTTSLITNTTTAISTSNKMVGDGTNTGMELVFQSRTLGKDNKGKLKNFYKSDSRFSENRLSEYLPPDYLSVVNTNDLINRNLLPTISTSANTQAMYNKDYWPTLEEGATTRPNPNSTTIQPNMTLNQESQNSNIFLSENRLMSNNPNSAIFSNDLPTCSISSSSDSPATSIFKNYSKPPIDVSIRDKFGSLGANRTSFNSPHGFCLTDDENIVIADTNNHRIQIFSLRGDFIHQFGSPGRESGELWYPRKVAMLKKEKKYVVCDRGSERSRMQIFSQNGTFLRKIIIRYIDIVAGLAVSDDDEIVAVDSVSPTVFRIAKSGELIRWFDCSDHMKEPSDLAIRNKFYYVCDFKGHSVVVFNEDGTCKQKIGTENITNFPNGIDVLPNGYILVGDSHGNRFHIALFDESGGLLHEFECPYVKVSRCCGLKITKFGHIITLAKNNHHVLILNSIFNLLPPTT
ncbi:hypothetical protein SNEBB_009362 [Seison nebaliae]|nr:hypothetical protein SNEBB_009362 [Seison nebaliae]